MCSGSETGGSSDGVKNEQDTMHTLLAESLTSQYANTQAIHPDCWLLWYVIQSHKHFNPSKHPDVELQQL